MKYRSLINLDLLMVIVLSFGIAKVAGWYIERDINLRRSLFLTHQGERANPAAAADSVPPLIGHSIELKIGLDNKTKDLQ